MWTDTNRKGRVEHILFIENCEKRKAPVTGKVNISRSKSIVCLEGRTIAEADSKVKDFCEGKNVVLLEKERSR